MDYPRDAIMVMATEAIKMNGGPTLARVHFKFTCPKCKTRCTFSDPNSLYESGTCCNCGHDAPVTAAGFALEIKMSADLPWLP